MQVLGVPASHALENLLITAVFYRPFFKIIVNTLALPFPKHYKHFWLPGLHV